MESLFEFRNRLRIGQALRIIFYSEEGAVAVNATFSNVETLAIFTHDSNAAMVKPGTRAMLILSDKGQYVKAEGEVTEWSNNNGGYSITLADQLWEVVDRRRYPRYDMQVPVFLRAITEKDGEHRIQDFNAKTQDLSIGGAWVNVDECPELGSLVEFQANLGNGVEVRMLGVVASISEDKTGFGLEFLDYVGGSRYTLHDYLSKAA